MLIDSISSKCRMAIRSKSIKSRLEVRLRHNTLLLEMKTKRILDFELESLHDYLDDIGKGRLF